MEIPSTRLVLYKRKSLFQHIVQGNTIANPWRASRSMRSQIKWQCACLQISMLRCMRNFSTVLCNFVSRGPSRKSLAILDLAPICPKLLSAEIETRVKGQNRRG